ncbi:uncharacterized protein LOC128257175 [Drosophila gunungcola]|uniref:Uncharacterized protein n=1 Tax=Drosophila gunungcola TaxID=103775 RepID=A0A9P9YPZ9_9MUSC|nr:uncharacterized protein LOC128257175 [Drosophila gunungcola]KAI8040966.1 hypothetical protein M5D96_005215 [Drosophila gunungcola]
MFKIIWLIAALSSTAHSFYDQMICANCSNVNEECKILTTGWSCEFEADAKKLDPNLNSTQIPSSLRECLLPGMGFKKEKAIIGYCCFWSPEMGCQKLKKLEIENRRCHKCTREIWSSVMENKTCPCGSWFLGIESSALKPKSRSLTIKLMALCTFFYSLSINV